ncbi:MAG: hypothetical protein ACI837_000700 [Crocinitomicaceae bacterium]|jgi:hypothetical protein
MKSLITCLLLLFTTYSFSQETQVEIEEVSLEVNQNIIFEQSQMHVLKLDLSGMPSSDQNLLKQELYRFNNYVLSIELDDISSTLNFKHKTSLPKTSVLVFLEDHGIASSHIVNY